MATSLRYLLALAACVATSVLALPLASAIAPTNIAMLYLLCVAGVASWLGSGPAVLASFVSVALFDWCFVPPRFTFVVEDAQYLITFGVMLGVGLLIGQLTARMRERAEDADRRERQNRALYEMTRELSATRTTAEVGAIAQRFLASQVGAVAVLHLPPFTDSSAPVHAVFESGQPRIVTVAQRGYEQALLMPLRSPIHTRGVLEIASAEADYPVLAARRMPLLEAVASIVAIAVERIVCAEVERDAVPGGGT